MFVVVVAMVTTCFCLHLQIIKVKVKVIIGFSSQPHHPQIIKVKVKVIIKLHPNNINKGQGQGHYKDYYKGQILIKVKWLNNKGHNKDYYKGQGHTG